jgi:enoyl-[acyl-carrier-protein] reductase (NADH)
MTARDFGAFVLLGSAGGIGGTVAEAYAAAFPDAPVWITFVRDRDGATALRYRIGRGEVVRVDSTSEGDIAALASAIRSAGHRVRTLVHGTVDARTDDLLGNADQLMRAIDVSAVSLVRAVGALDDLLDEGSTVFYLSSSGGSRVTRRYGHVGVAKAAGNSIVRYLAVELGRRGIRVNSVACGPVATKAFDAIVGDGAAAVAATAKRSVIQPAPGAPEVADLIVAMSGDAGRAITGQYLSADGGLSLRM